MCCRSRPGRRRLAGTRYSAVAAVFVAGAGRQGTLPYDAIAQIYQLTGAELRVLFGIVEIGGVPEVASTLGIAETTVKTHLQHVFENRHQPAGRPGQAGGGLHEPAGAGRAGVSMLTAALRHAATPKLWAS